MLALAQSVPLCIEIGADTTLTASIRGADDALSTVTACTLTLRDGSEILVDAAGASSLGPPPTYALAGTVTSSRSPSEMLSLRWTATIGGAVYHLQQGAYLVRTAYTSTLTEADLLARHADLYEYLNDGVTTAQAYRIAANERIQRALIKKGRRPWLIFDKLSLFDAELALALALLFRDNRSSAGEGTCKELAAEYLAEFEAEMGSITFREDTAEVGYITETTQRSASPVVMAGVGPYAAALGYPRAVRRM